jgi:hypothetical protein
VDIERLRALEKKWRGIGDAKHSKAEGPFAVESDKIANLCEGDLCHQFADELATLIAELGQEVGAVAPVAWMLVTKNGTLPYQSQENCKRDAALIGREDVRVRPLTYGDTSPAHTSEARDAARLDWLVNRGASVDYTRANHGQSACRVIAFGEPLTDWLPTHREAIDAAMRQEGGSDA